MAKSIVEVKIEKRIYTGWEKAAGGVTPNMISRIIPPPTAVVAPRTFTPKISIFFSMAVMAPEEAKAIVPMISRKNINVSIKSSFCKSNILHRGPLYHIG